MKTFIKFINEFATIRGKYEYIGSMENEWEKYKDSKFTKLIIDKLGSNHYKLYKYGSTYYLTDEEDKYAGYIDGEIKNKKFYISKSASNIDRGFYQTVFVGLFAGLNIDEIFSDKDLSIDAVNSYNKMANYEYSPFNVRILTKNGYSPFSKELLAKDNNIVSITEKDSIKESYSNYIYKISKIDEETGTPSPWMIAYNNKESACDNLLFNEYFN